MSVDSTIQSNVLKVKEANGRYRVAVAAEVLAAAEGLLSGMIMGTVLMNRPEAVESYLKVKLAGLEHEVFGCLFLDASHKLLEYSELFRGTVNQTAVYPREVIKAALAINSSAVIFVHNHPSGAAEPSRADELLTENLRKALLMIGVEVLDHLIVARTTVVSMARRGCFAI
jgi:DNA repair protein RadC